ncbi:MAG: HAMP domain-containing histidine kinase [Sphingobacteriaceae bacterium]|nr:HAMP domain-containing histidine kinase [Sphingobacteriaceae bacterium]MBK7816827.1 HAMP domain-containing histidine kinase [Sphingobacteriaceae bacterium]
MKLNRTYLFIAVSSLALVIVLVIQVNWIFETAAIKEELFNEKANMVLAKTAEALSSDKETCKSIADTNQASGNIVINACNSTEICITNTEIRKIDSIFKRFMNFYNFYIDYSFVVVKPTPFKVKNGGGFKNNIYNKRLEEVVSQNGSELVLILPDKNQFIMDEMGTPFISSVVLILVVLIMFWRTVLSLMKEKRISEHTTDFLNNMTHEFKTPLTNIALASKMILKDPVIKQQEKLKHYSEIVLEENEKLRLKVEQMLSMTALERGEVPLQKTEIDLHQLIRDSIKSIHIQIENKQGVLELKLQAEKFVIMGDETHLTNALCNLIDNAVKYSTGKPELLIETYNVDEHIIILISDKGVGIPKAYHEKVFEKFFRVPSGNVHNIKGFGLGLAYVKKIIELHEGTIELESEKGEGTTFTLTLPHA